MESIPRRCTPGELSVGSEVPAELGGVLVAEENVLRAALRN